MDPSPSSDPTVSPDDAVLPFQLESAGATGRVVRLGTVVDTILGRHDYPESVSKLLGEAVALTAMLGTSLKFEGTFIFQASTNGPVDLLVVDLRTPGGLRGYAHYDADAVAALEADGAVDGAMLLGEGHLAMTIDRGSERDRYQGIVPLENADLNAAARTYFRQSEQLPTFLRVATARHYRAGEGGGDWGWRAGGLLIQNIASEGGRATLESEGPRPDEEDEDWRRITLLSETLEDHEILDPMLTSEALLYRLFNEEIVRTFRPRPLEGYCRCSEERINALIEQFTAEEVADMIEDGKITVTCEFCSQRYVFDPAQFA